MSNKVTSLVYSRAVGSAHRKAVLAYMADKASDGGEGVFCSKGTIADETEIARSTVFKIIKELVAEGVLIERGTRACRNGHTVIYDMDLTVIGRFPMSLSDPGKTLNQSASRTSTAHDQSASRTPPVRQPDPYQSASRTQTTLRTILEHGGGGSAGASSPISQQKPDVANPTFREQILEAIGVDPVSGLTGHGGSRIGTQADMAEAGRWLELDGMTPELAIGEIRRLSVAKRDGPPKSFRYFTEAMCRLSGEISAPKLTPIEAQHPRSPTASGETEQEKILRLMRSVGINTNVESM